MAGAVGIASCDEDRERQQLKLQLRGSRSPPIFKKKKRYWDHKCGVGGLVVERDFGGGEKR